MASELRVNTITSTTGVGTVTLGSGGVSFSGTPTFNDVTLSSINGNAISGTRNRIINGDMRIDQRNAGASVNSISATNPYTLDRWRSVGTSGSGQFSVQQNAGSVTPPTGFTNYLGVTSLAATTVASGDYYAIRQPLEGYNVADFAFGTSSAVSITLSFWVRSSLAGAFGGAILNNANNRSYPFAYTISAANTWERKSVVIAGDTTGTWTTNNTTGIDLFFSLGAGSIWTGTAGTWADAGYKSPTGATSVVGTNGATFFLTGVQFESGTVATPFERRSYGQELALCQRYYQRFNNIYAEGYSSGAQVRQNTPMSFPVQMRATPTRTVITAGSYTNIRSSSSVYAGLGINGLTDSYVSCSMESAAAGYMSMSNQSESMSSEL